ncbi:MAG: cell division protein ZapA [Flavobacteriales bacterium]|jgi:cell division protein ZapA|nr:cell division protein ZapA [Flavobacteriales bacterium]|tara:strand:- start:3 stop:284 length:282 start_codon:yes stop_codon:yes gene_type:complete
MDKLSIKLNIANRFYPMKIERSSEENIRNAVKKIDDRLKFYEDNYEIKDKQDLLAMCLIEYASKLEKINKNKFINDDGISEKLSNLDKLLSDF